MISNRYERRRAMRFARDWSARYLKCYFVQCIGDGFFVTDRARNGHEIVATFDCGVRMF